ncbi:MAG: hypothetical protein KF712_21285 [Akkermansiaceae bacterium]|nr:hypothetical protein [Akkermansiaceae bacterium]
MKNPSIRARLILGTGVLVALTLWGANVAIYRAFKRTLYKEVDSQLLVSASLLAKSAELEANSLDYEWKEAMKSAGAPEIAGVFAFWDMKSGKVTKSPELGDRDLPLIYGGLNQPRKESVTLADGRSARVVGILHYPFTDQAAIDEAARQGRTLRPEDYPQVVVCARETDSLIARLAELKGHLTRGALATLIAIWASIFAISTWSLRPIREFGAKLLARSESDTPGESAIPRTLPSELVGLARIFNLALGKVEKSREREKEFALHAAHELRTPISGVYVTLEQAVMRDRPAADLKQRIQEALHILGGVRVTLNSLMRLARLRGGLEGSTRALFEPDAIVREVLDSFDNMVAARGMDLSADLQTDVPAISNDRGLFKAAASNLIGNAVRHAPAGGKIHVRLATTGNELILLCENTLARNVELSQIDKWFQPFHRGSEAADDEGGHAGLGLSLTREAANLMGGKVDVDLGQDLVIRFSLTVPV